jgi:chemotaxis protein CheD
VDKYANHSGVDELNLSDFSDKSRNHFINVGEFYFSDNACFIHTILGSCIAITLWHPILKIGGMCHFVLPMRPNSIPSASHNGRYSDGAMALFEEQAKLRNTLLKDYQGKIFGGSNMLSLSSLNEDESVGMKNAEAAMEQLAQRGIPILVAHVGETGQRRIAFNVSNGDVWVKHTPLQKVVPQNNQPD